MALRTEFPFTLPKGYIDGEGNLHRHGTMRLSTARDEIEPLRSRDIAGPDDPYLTILVLARVITELGSLPQITAVDVENLFAADLAFLQDLYGIINFGDPADVEALQASVLPDEPDTEGAVQPEPDLDPDPIADTDDGDGIEDDDDDQPDRPISTRRTRGSVEEVTRTTAS
jgi:hypothetical protein